VAENGVYGLVPALLKAGFPETTGQRYW
jgi:hypothetical protein